MAQSSILTTKLYIPSPRPSLVRRPRLLALLDESINHKLTLVSAAAGSGKTTLLAEWSQKETKAPTLIGRVAWLSLGSRDNTLARFLTYLVAALQQVEPGLGREIQARLSASESVAGTVVPEALLNPLINELIAVRDHVVLVLDDYHVVEAADVQDAVAFLLDHLPPQLHLILATRVDPPLPLARLRTNQEMLEIRAADLRFTPEEAKVFLNEIMGLKLSAAENTALEERTEGWIAGLQLAALALKSVATAPKRLAAEFIRGFSGRNHHIVAYLVEEVLSQQPEPIQRFLLQTAILERFNSDLCDTVTGQDGSHMILAHLYQANLFIHPLDDEHTWYRYHHLFAEALVARLHVTHPEGETKLHRQAAIWFGNHDQAEESVAHALAAEDFDLAADLIARFGEQIWTDKQAGTLLQWLQVLPTDCWRGRPYLSLLYAWSLWLTGRWGEVEPALAIAEASLAAYVPGSTKEEQPFSVLQGMVAAVRANLARLEGNPAETVQQAQAALQFLPAGEQLWRGIMAQYLGDGQRLLGNVAAAEPAYRQAIWISQAAGNMYATLTAIRNLAELQQEQGRLHQAAASYHRALSLAARTNSRQLSATANVHIWLGRLLGEWHRLAEAQRHLETGIAISRTNDYSIGLITGQTELARIHQLQGNLDSAGALLRQANALAERYNVANLQNHVAALLAYLHLVKARDYGDESALPAALRWAREQNLTPQSWFSFFDRTAITYTCLLLFQDQCQAALTLLDTLQAVANKMGRTGDMIRVLILQALAYWAGKRRQPARERLQQALCLAQPEGFIRPFLEEGSWIKPLLNQTLENGLPQPVTAFARRLQPILFAIELKQRSLTPSTTPAPTYGFTKREQDVLRLLVVGLSNRQIARELVVAESTVKTHLNNIYRKLRVHSRSQVLARLRELRFT